MKIGLFSHVRYPFTNGISTSVEQLAKELRIKDHEVYIISNNYNNLKNDFSSQKDLKVVSLPIFYQNLRTPILFNPQLFKELDKLKLDVLHSHSDFGLGVISRAYSKKENIPLIHTYHCNYLEYAKENFGKVISNASFQPVKLYTEVLCETANRIIVPSEETKRLLREEFDIEKELDLVPNGVDLSKFTNKNLQKILGLKKKFGIDNNDFILLCLSRLSKEKRIDDIIKLMAYLEDCINLKLLIVGGGPEEEKLKHLAKKNNLKNVIFVGEISFNEVQNYYQLADIFVANSIAETQGLSIIEAMASSVPVVCPNAAIYNQIIENGKNGFKYNNYREFLTILKKLYKNKNVLNNMKKNAELSSQKFSLENSANKIERIYMEEQEKNKVLKKLKRI